MTLQTYIDNFQIVSHNDLEDGSIKHNECLNHEFLQKHFDNYLRLEMLFHTIWCKSFKT